MLVPAVLGAVEVEEGSSGPEAVEYFGETECISSRRTVDSVSRRCFMTTELGRRPEINQAVLVRLPSAVTLPLQRCIASTRPFATAASAHRASSDVFGLIFYNIVSLEVCVDGVALRVEEVEGTATVVGDLEHITPLHRRTSVDVSSSSSSIPEQAQTVTHTPASALLLVLADTEAC